MTAPTIPSEDDFMAALEADGEKLRQLTGEDHGPFQLSSPRDFVAEALADGLIPDGDTRSTFERNYVPVSQRGAPAPGQSPKTPTKNTTWPSDRAWVDAQKICLGLTVLECQVDEWEEENERALQILHDKGDNWSGLYNEIACDAVGEARENARSLRFL